MNALIERLIGWLRAGYPSGVPEMDYMPLLALLRRRLSDDEIQDLGAELVLQGIIPAETVDVGVGITKVTDELPSEQEVRRVSNILRAGGWPVTPDQDAPDD